MIIDAHAHVWPDQIAAAALTANPVPGLQSRGDGTVDGLMADMATSGVDISCCLGVANEARHVERVNQFVASIASQQRYPVGSIHLDLSVEENMRILEENNIRAVKVHPLFQNLALNDKRLWDLFDAFGERIAVITHVGEGGDAYRNSLSNPQMVADIVHQFPSLRLVACHFGGYRLFDDARNILDNTDIVLETSWPPTLAELHPEKVRDLIRHHGADRIVFGSDWPMTSPFEEMKVLESLGLTDVELEAIFGGTLARVFEMDTNRTINN